MKFYLIDFKLLFALLVCLCLIVSISNIYAMDVDESIDDSQPDVIDIDSVDDKEAYCSFGWTYGEIDNIAPESIDCDTISIQNLPTDTDDIDLFVNNPAKSFHKHIFKKPHHHKLCNDGTQLTCHHKHHHKLCEDETHLTCHHRHYSQENSVLDNHVTDIDANFSDDFYCYEDFYVNNQDVIFSNYTQLNTKGFIAIPRNLDKKEEDCFLVDLTFNCSQILDDEIYENDFTFTLNDSDVTSCVDCESLSLPDTDLNAENYLTMNYMNSLDSECMSFDSYDFKINNSNVENHYISEDNLEYSIFANSISIIEESAVTVENLSDLSVLTFNNTVEDKENVKITITQTVTCNNCNFKTDFNPESRILKDNFEIKELTDLFFDELSAQHCTSTTFYEINFYILGNIPFDFIGTTPNYCSNNHNISIFWRNMACLI